MKKSLNNEIRANLQAFADRITPPDTKPGSVPGKALTAEELREKYGISTDRHGNPLKAGQLYLAKDMPAVNHFRRLCKAYERGGWDQVERYLQPYKTPAAIARDIEASAQASATAPVVQLATEGVPGYEQALTAHLSRNERVVKAIETYPAILAAEPAPVATAAQRLGNAYEAGVADVPEELWKNYRREISPAEYVLPCTAPCLPNGACPARCFND